MYNWKDDYVVGGKLKDGWYYIRTWDDMKDQFGLKLSMVIKLSPSFTAEMEGLLPPIRCIKVVDGEWIVYNKEYRRHVTHYITPEMVASPAYTIGKEYEFSDDGIKWTNYIYTGFDFDCNEHFTNGSVYKYCREIKSETIEITVRINGKEAKLSDISNETLQKLKDTE